MAETTVLSGLELQKWQRRFVREYVRDSGFEPYMGSSPTDIIYVKNDLQATGAKIRVPLVKRLQSAGVTGNQRLKGNEESLDQYYQDVEWEMYRNALVISKTERGKSAVDLMGVREPLLREWASELIKYQVIEQFHSINEKTYSAASEAEKDAWLAANTDRVLFGAAVSNHAADHSAALANIDASADKLSPEMITLAKRRARYASPHIKPFKSGTGGKEYFVLFAHPLCFRDLKNNSTMTQANREARERGVDSNPIFQDGDLIYDGVIIREIPEFLQPRFDDDTSNTDTNLVGVGAASINVGANFLCGQSALCMVNKQTATPVTDTDDYGYFSGAGIELGHGFSKMRWANGTPAAQDFGMMTVYASATADA